VGAVHRLRPRGAKAHPAVKAPVWRGTKGTRDMHHFCPHGAFYLAYMAAVANIQCSKSGMALVSASRTLSALPMPRTHPPLTSKTF
jgi:hypothetical protein